MAASRQSALPGCQVARTVTFILYDEAAREDAGVNRKTSVRFGAEICPHFESDKIRTFLNYGLLNVCTIICA
jgi:hypothetical protein